MSNHHHMIFGTPNSTFLTDVMSQLKVGSNPTIIPSTTPPGATLSAPSNLSTSPLSFSTSIPSSTGTSSENVALFDIGWEVAKKVGGIYTVLKSKAPITVEEYKSSYALIGPYNPDTAATEFEPLTPGPLTQPVIDNMMKKYGIQVHFGKWLIESYPKVFLIDIKSSSHKLGEWRWDLMSGFEQPGDTETNETIIFGYQVALLLKEFAENTPGIGGGERYIAHFHEWQAAVGLILLRRWKVPSVSTIFTTHATLLGRYLSAGGVDLYNQMGNFNMDYEASKRGIYHRHWIEKRAANDAHVFTTVSEITAFESETILQRKADVILPNGLKLDKFTALHEFQNLHAKYKSVIHEFIRGHFYGHYDFDLDNTLYFFTAGRSEYFNKGVDMYLDSLAALNRILQQSGSNLTVVAFIIMPAKTNNFNVESLKGQSQLRDMRRTCNSIVESMGERLFEATSRGSIVSYDSLLNQEDLIMLKRRILALKQRASLPPIVTHNMVDDANDPILNHLRRIKLFNAPTDRVKIIYHPEFLNSTNPLIPLDYTEFVRGCHLGIFASYYEPWGYTPAECTALGVPSITSNLTGFANFMNRFLKEPSSKGIYIVDRRFKSPQDSVDQMTQYLWKFCQMDRRQRIELRNSTEKLSELLDWRNLGKYYTTARALALERAFPPVRPSSPNNFLKLSSSSVGSNSSSGTAPIQSTPTLAIPTPTIAIPTTSSTGATIITPVTPPKVQLVGTTEPIQIKNIVAPSTTTNTTSSTTTNITTNNNNVQTPIISVQSSPTKSTPIVNYKFNVPPQQITNSSPDSTSTPNLPSSTTTSNLNNSGDSSIKKSTSLLTASLLQQNNNTTNNTATSGTSKPPVYPEPNLPTPSKPSTIPTPTTTPTKTTVTTPTTTTSKTQTKK